MTLIVSLRIPDGLVLAADSLSTITGKIGIAADIKTECPECKKEIKLPELKMPPFPFPTSTFSYAQKLFPFHKKFGVASRGMAFVSQKSIYYHVQYLEDQNKEKDIDKVTTVAQIFRDYFDIQIKKQIKDLKNAPDNFFPLGFHVVGYDEDIGKTMVVDIGKNSRIKEYIGIGCTVSGDRDVVMSLWSLGEKNPQQKANYGSFSLQDGIDYAEFLIRTTSSYQRFSNMIPTVGGDIDIALITQYKEFTWIKQKKLMKVLEDQKQG